MKTLIAFALLILISCSKSNDTQPIDFPVPGLLGSWTLSYVSISNCGGNDSNFTPGKKKFLNFTSTKASNGNYMSANIGNEYQLKGDSIILFFKDTDGIYVDFFRGTYTLANTLDLKGKYTKNLGSLNNCSAEYYLQK